MSVNSSMAQTVPTWTKGRGLLTEFVTSLGHGSDRFASLCLHTLTRTRETSCRTNCCCKKKKGPESWVKHAKPYDPTFPATFLAVIQDQSISPVFGKSSAQSTCSTEQTIAHLALCKPESIRLQERELAFVQQH